MLNFCPDCGRETLPLYTYATAYVATYFHYCEACNKTHKVVVTPMGVTDSKTPMYSDNEGRNPLKQTSEGWKEIWQSN